MMSLVGVMVLNQGVSAAEMVESITMSPTNKRYQVKPGEMKADEITIVNDGKVGYDFIVYAQPYFVTGEEYKPDYNAKRANSDANKWVTFDKKRFYLEPGESVVIPFTVKVPLGAAPGGHYGVLFAETQSANSANSGNSVLRKKRIGSVIYATVTDGYYRNEGSVLSQNTSFFQFQPPLEAFIRVKNSGNTDFVSQTLLEVKNMFGKTVHTDTKEFVVLPETIRMVPFAWEKVPGFGLYKVTIATSFLSVNKNTVHYVLIAPLWTYLLLAIALLAGIMYWLQLRR